jgi:hypothetical protein
MEKIINFLKKESLLVAVLVLAAAFFAVAFSGSSPLVLSEGQFRHNLIIENAGEYEVILEEGATAGEALDLVVTKNNITVEYLDFDFGRMVKKIGEKESDNQYFWALYHNDEMATVGADSLQLKEGDKTEWKFEELKF